MTREKEFCTTSLHFAAWLMAAKLLTYKRTAPGLNPRQQIFVFEDNDNRGTALEREFFNSSPTVSVKPYNEAVRLLRTQFSGGASNVATR